jgi:hypothetical protein
MYDTSVRLNCDHFLPRFMFVTVQIRLVYTHALLFFSCDTKVRSKSGEPPAFH